MATRGVSDKQGLDSGLSAGHDEEEQKRSKRTSKACDFCRSKKVKCDGQTLCQNCKNHKVVCTYNYVSKKRSMPKRSGMIIKREPVSVATTTSTPATTTTGRGQQHHAPGGPSATARSRAATGRVHKLRGRVRVGGPEVESRLSKMEAMMQALVQKIAPDLDFDSGDSGRSPEEETESDIDDDSNEDNDDGNSGGTPRADSSLEISERSSLKPMLERGVNTGMHQCTTIDERFFVPHTAFSMFSAKGLRWMAGRLKNKKTMIPLKRVTIGSLKLEQESISIWVEPISKNDLKPLPSREVIELVMSILLPISPLSNPVDLLETKAKLMCYCDSRDGLIDAKFTFADLLLMNSTVLVACAVVAEQLKSGLILPDVVNLDSLQSMEKDLLDNCIFYYHRVTLASEGVIGLQGTLFLAVYTDVVSLLQVPQLLITSAVRQAQEIGLHREESYHNLSTRDRERRINLWWKFYVFDKEMCLKSGKPPILNDTDISAPPVPGFEGLWSLPGERLNDGRHKREVLRTDIRSKLESLLREPRDLASFELYVDYDLSSISSRAYNELFSATAMKGKTRSQIVELITSLLHDIECWRLCIPESIRPDPEGSFYLDSYQDVSINDDKVGWFRFVIMSYHLKFFHLQMTIAKFFVSLNWEIDNSPLNASFNAQLLAVEKVCLSATRSILRFSNQPDNQAYRYICFSIFYPFCAYLTLFAQTIKAPTSPDAVQDIHLLHAAAKNFFAVMGVNKPTKSHKWALMDQVARALLYMASTLVLECNPGLELDFGDLLDDVKAEAERGDLSNQRSLRRVSNRFSSGMTSNLNSPAMVMDHRGHQNSNQGYQTVSALHSGGDNGLNDMNSQQQSQPSMADVSYGNFHQGTNGSPMEQNIFNHILDGVKNDNMTPYNSEDSLLDGIQTEGGFLFQNVFTIPTYMADLDPSNDVFSHGMSVDLMGMPNAED